ncbi:MAG TPA: glycosyltransferase family 9 protein [Candidatus Tectomicrobia bacterium]|nr:glycosyltransferase family 9 protein [Candidatus Tectomicrobia bacterium]
MSPGPTEFVEERIAAQPWRGEHPPMRVLAIRLHALGDTVLTLPYLDALRRHSPPMRLDFLTRREVAEIPRSVVLFDRVFALAGGRDPRRQMLAALALAPWLRSRRYDVVIDLQRNRISRLVRRLLAPSAWSEFDRFSPRLAGERTRATIEAAGFSLGDVRPELVLKDPDAGRRLLVAAGWDPSNKLVVLNPAGAFSGRNWPLASYAAFAKLWLERVSHATQFAILGLPQLAGKARELKRLLDDQLVDLVGRTSAVEAFAVLAGASLVLSEDSGLLHIAWVAGAPTLGLFGASRGDWSRPHGNYSDCILACRGLESACLVDGRCHAAPPTCLERVPPEQVLDRARALAERVTGLPKVIDPAGSSGPQRPD